MAQAGGNTALALMLLVLTNMLAVFTVPFLFRAVLSSNADSVSISATSLLLNLVITILIPAIVGKVLPHINLPFLHPLAVSRGLRVRDVALDCMVCVGFACGVFMQQAPMLQSG